MRPKHFLVTAFLITCAIKNMQAQGVDTVASKNSGNTVHHPMNFYKKLTSVSIALKKLFHSI